MTSPDMQDPLTRAVREYLAALTGTTPQPQNDTDTDTSEEQDR